MVKRILIVHTRGGVGDVLLSTPVASALQRTWPAARITWMVRNGAADMVRHHPSVHDVIVVPDQGWAVEDYLARVRADRYDAGVVLWSKATEAWLLYRAGIPVRVGQAGRLLYSFLFTHRVHVRSDRGDTTSHWVDIQLDYARALGVRVDDASPLLVPSAAARQKAAEWLPDGPSYIGLSVGKGLPLTRERWPVAVWSAIAEALQSALGGRIVLTGSPAETDIVRAVAEKLAEPPIELAGRTSLDELAGVIERCSLFVCPDSGPMHMAAALGIPTVGVFAMRAEFPHRWRPYGTHGVVVRPQPVTCPMTCRKEICERFPCYEAVTPQAVVQAAAGLLHPQPNKPALS